MNRLLDLNDLMVEQLRELFDGELQLALFLRELAPEVQTHQLVGLVKSYEKKVEENHWTIGTVFNDLFTQKKGEKGLALKHLMDNTRLMMSRCNTHQLRDAAVILGLQHIIHYKIATYGAICTYANIQKLYEAAENLHRLLEEEKRMDFRLAMLADKEIDPKAYRYELS